MPDHPLSLFALPLAVALGIGLGIGLWRLRTRALVRERRVRAYEVPVHNLLALQATYPHLQLRDLELVAKALRGFLVVRLRAGSSPIELPSRSVATLWASVAQDKQSYAAFCAETFGSPLSPAPAVSGRAQDGDPESRGEPTAAMRLTWRLACQDEYIDPQAPTRLPLLFAVDAKLRIPDGLHHRLEDFMALDQRERGDDDAPNPAIPAAALAKGKGRGVDSESTASGDGGDGGGE